MFKINLTTEELSNFIQLFKKYIVIQLSVDSSISIVCQNELKPILLENGFEEKDIKPVFVPTLTLVNEVKTLLGNPKSFKFRYYSMKGQYLLTC